MGLGGVSAGAAAGSVTYASGSQYAGGRQQLFAETGEANIDFDVGK